MTRILSTLLGTPGDALARNLAEEFTAGGGDSEVNRVWHDERTLAPAATDSFDLLDGTLTDDFGDSVAFDEIRAFFIQNLNAISSEDVIEVLGSPSSRANNAFFAYGSFVPNLSLYVPAGGCILQVRPYELTLNANEDTLRVRHVSGGAVTYRIVLIGSEGSSG